MLKKLKNRQGKFDPRYLVEYIILASVAFFLSAVAILLIVDNMVMPLYLRAGMEFSAPDLRGMTVYEAERFVSEKDLTIIVSAYEYSPEYPEDTIALQMPSPGTVIKPGRRIHVNISQGSHPYTVPDVKGKSERNAILQIQNAGLFVREVFHRPSRYPYGIVLDQQPEAGSSVPHGTGIVLYISSGERFNDVVMPNLINMSVSAAQDTLVRYGFRFDNIKVEFETDEDMLPLTVIEQYPDPGTAAYSGDEVNLVVSR